MRNNTAWRVVKFLALTFVAATAWAETPKAENRPAVTDEILVLIEEGVPGGVIIETEEIKAEVVSIDYETRTATLKGPAGNLVPVAPGPEAINFNQVKQGDTVRVRITTALNIFIGDEIDELLDGAEGLAVLAGEGEQPGGFVAETVQETATVAAVDLEARSATLKFRDGSEQVVKVRPDIDLSEERVGQKVVIQSATEIAIDVMAK